MQRRTTFATKNIITFELECLNEGETMNLTTGIFTAPGSGIYYLELSALKDLSIPQLSVWKGLSLTASLQLHSKDRVNVFNDQGMI